MKIVNLGESNSVLNRFVAELRDVNIQKDSMRFRRNIERIGEIMAYEISKDFTYSKKGIQSPLVNRRKMKPPAEESSFISATGSP